jgi:hypothetical protein
MPGKYRSNTHKPVDDTTPLMSKPRSGSLMIFRPGRTRQQESIRSNISLNGATSSALNPASKSLYTS